MPRSPLNSVQIPANAHGGRSSFSANQTTSFLPVAGFASGAYSVKLVAGTKQRFSGFSQGRQFGDDVLRILVTGGPPRSVYYGRNGWKASAAPRSRPQPSPDLGKATVPGDSGKTAQEGCRLRDAP